MMADKRGAMHTASNDRSPCRAELILLLLVALAAFLLRFAHPARMAVEHFDEGVYASGVWFDADDGYRYPDRHLYAPPLLPLSIESLILLMGPSHLATLLVSVLAGSLSVAVIWCVARAWFGPQAGLSAAALAAFSDFHLLYSRTALTDVMLGFWLLLSAYCLWKSISEGSFGWAAAAGLSAAGAWWTKYNGWLPLAVGLAGTIPWLIQRRLRTVTAGRAAACWAVACFVAALAWSPVVFGLQQYGGYAAVAANHRTYLHGLSEWLPALLRQAANLGFVDGWPTAVGLGLSVLLPAVLLPLSRRSFTWNPDLAEPREARAGTEQSGTASPSPESARLPTTGPAAHVLQYRVVFAALAAGAVAVLPSGMLLLAGGVAGCCVQLFDRSRAEGTEILCTSRRHLAAWMTTAWFLCLLAATPFYRPYPRLVLPWLISAWLGCAALVGWWLRADGTATAATPSGKKAERSRGISALLVLVSLAASAWLAAERFSPRPVGWQERTGLERIAQKIVERIAREADRGHQARAEPIFLYVYAEPALFFHISALAPHRIAAGPVSNLDFVRPADPPPMPTFLATGPHAHRSQRFAEHWRKLGDRFETVQQYDYVPSDLVRLNHHPPAALAGDDDQRPDEQVRLYRLR